MTYDYKRLCNELLSYLYQCNWPDGKRFYALAKRAEAALVEPKPPSLKEQALDAWDRLRNEAWCEEIDFDLNSVRRALESLPD
jgi:hypothetical protein